MARRVRDAGGAGELAGIGIALPGPVDTRHEGRA